MTKKPSKKKNNYLGFRLPMDDLQKLDLIALQEGKSRGLIAKAAIRDWINYELLNQNNEILLMSKTFIIRLLSLIDEQTMIKLAQEIGDILASIMDFLVSKPMDQKSLNDYGLFTIRFFGKRGLNWFNSIDIKILNSNLIFRGYHDLEENFSFFFIEFYKHILNEHFNLDFISQNEEYTSSLINLEFKLKP